MNLTKAQEALLRRVVKSNGGGVADFNIRTAKKLHEEGLIQGKSGEPWVAVHTADGLAWVRSNPTPTNGAKE